MNGAPPDCRTVARWLQSFLDHEIDHARADEVRQHLDRCRWCGLERDAYLEIKRILATGAAVPDEEARAIQRLRAFVDDLARDGDGV